MFSPQSWLTTGFGAPRFSQRGSHSPISARAFSSSCVVQMLWQSMGASGLRRQQLDFIANSLRINTVTVIFRHYCIVRCHAMMGMKSGWMRQSLLLWLSLKVTPFTCMWRRVWWRSSSSSYYISNMKRSSTQSDACQSANGYSYFGLVGPCETSVQHNSCCRAD